MLNTKPHNLTMTLR
jgi:hypothetical protein